MRRKKRSWISLAVGVVGLFLLFFLMIYIRPSYVLPLGPIQLSIVFPFYIIVLSTVYAFTYFLTKSKTHGVLVGLLLVGFLLFRMNDLTHPFFMFLLIALFLTLELLFTKPRQ